MSPSLEYIFYMKTHIWKVYVMIHYVLFSENIIQILLVFA